MTALIHPFDAPAHDEPVELRPGLFWLRTKLPFALDHINLWLTDDGDGWTLIDTGVGDAATRALWDRLLDGLLAGRPVRRLIGTHFHPDHVGQAGYPVERTGAELVMARTEFLAARALSLDTSEGFVAAGEAMDRKAGLDEAMARTRRGRGNMYRRGLGGELPAAYARLAHGDATPLLGGDAEVIAGEGHSPEQLTFWSAERRLLIAADQLLPRITPVVGVWASEPEADPLGEFLRSLDRFRHLPEDALILPSHGLPYQGLHARLASLRAHHEERLARTLSLLAEPATAASVMRGLFTHRALAVADVGFALAETLAHLNHLRRLGTVTREDGLDGVWRFRRA